MKRPLRPLYSLFLFLVFASFAARAQQETATDWVNPLPGTATLWDSANIGYKPSYRTWDAEVVRGRHCRMPWYNCLSGMCSMPLVFTRSRRAEARYIVSVLLFQHIAVRTGSGKAFTIVPQGSGKKIADITVLGVMVGDYFVSDEAIKLGQTMVIHTR